MEDTMQFIDYNIYLNDKGDISLDEHLAHHQLGVKEGDLLRVSTDKKGRLSLQRFGHIYDDECD